MPGPQLLGQYNPTSLLFPIWISLCRSLLTDICLRIEMRIWGSERSYWRTEWEERDCAHCWGNWGTKGHKDWILTASSGPSNTMTRAPSSTGSALVSAPPMSSPSPNLPSQILLSPSHSLRHFIFPLVSVTYMHWYGDFCFAIMKSV